MATQEQVRAFVDKIGPIIKAEGNKRGYKIVSPIIAQACIESAYGTSSLGYKYNNYFGMKCGSSWKGKSVNLKTKEEYNSQLIDIRDNFRVYDSMEEGVAGYFDFISTKRYANLKEATTPKKYLELIKADGYATSSSYVATNMKVVESLNLTRFDSCIFRPITPELIANVIQGKYGNGNARAHALSNAGYNYEEVRAKVNELYSMAKDIKPFKDMAGEYFNCVLLFNV